MNANYYIFLTLLCLIVFMLSYFGLIFFHIAFWVNKPAIGRKSGLFALIFGIADLGLFYGITTLNIFIALIFGVIALGQFFFFKKRWRYFSKAFVKKIWILGLFILGTFALLAYKYFNEMAIN